MCERLGLKQAMERSRFSFSRPVVLLGKKRGRKLGECQLALNDISPTCVDQPWKRLIVLNSPETQNVLGVAGSVGGQKEGPPRPVVSGAVTANNRNYAARGGGGVEGSASFAFRGGGGGGGGGAGQRGK